MGIDAEQELPRGGAPGGLFVKLGSACEIVGAGCAGSIRERGVRHFGRGGADKRGQSKDVDRLFGAAARGLAEQVGGYV